MALNMEQIGTLITFNVLMAPMAVMGIVLCSGRGAGLIAGYNTAPAQERAGWNERALCRGTGALVLAFAGCIELSLLGAILDFLPLMWFGLALLALALPGGLLFLNRSRRFKRRDGGCEAPSDAAKRRDP